MQFFPLNKVVFQPEAKPFTSTINADILITIAVDVAYIIKQQGNTVSNGIYMMDNSVAGSTGEGSAGSIIGWNVVPIDPDLPNLDIEISFIQICMGSVFGSPATQLAGNGYTWIAELTYSGKQTYAIQIKMTEGLNSVTYWYNWIATIIAQ